MYNFEVTERARVELSKHLLNEPEKSIRIFVSGRG
jgi:hypothetical protein